MSLMQVPGGGGGAVSCYLWPEARGPVGHLVRLIRWPVVPAP